MAHEGCGGKSIQCQVQAKEIIDKKKLLNHRVFSNDEELLIYVLIYININTVKLRNEQYQIESFKFEEY